MTTINVSLLKEHADGSASYAFDLSEDMKDALLRFGIMKAIEAGLEASKELHPSFEGEPEQESDAVGVLTEGGWIWDGDQWQRPTYQGVQPTLEPKAWWDAKLGVFDEKQFDQLQPLYTTPPRREWVGLTTDYKQEWLDAMPYDPQPHHCMVLVNVIEAALKEKNT
jgi:hypothetical protein